MTTATPRRAYAPRLPAAERVEQLLDAALSLAVEKGFHALTVDGVSRAAGVTRPVFYGLFEDRAALLTALLERSERRALDHLAGVFPLVPDEDDLTTDPDELLVESVTAYLRAIAADPVTWRVILLPPEGAPPELHERLAANRRQLLSELRALCDWGLARRGGPAGLDPDLFARAVFTLAEGAARLLLVDPDRWSVDAFADFTRTSLAALRPGPRQEP